MIVLHLIRKNTHLKASFIQNQIISHLNFNTHVIFCESRDDELDGGFANSIDSNIPVYSISGKVSYYERFIYNHFRILSSRLKKNLVKLVTEIRPDILHFHYGTDAGIYLEVLKDVRVPKIVSFYGYDCSVFPSKYFGLGKLYLKNKVYPFGDVILAMSPYMRKDLINIGCPEKKIIVHYHGSNTRLFLRDHDYRNKPKIKFLIISGLFPVKGHLFLLRAFSVALKSNPNISLTIVGDGPFKKAIEDFIKSNGLSPYVNYEGPVVYGSRRHLQYFDEHDVFIHPSVSYQNGDKEGIPGAIVEAMAAGLPVISTFHGGIPHIIQNNINGLLVKEWEIDGLAERVVQIANDDKLRKKIGTSGQRFVCDNLDLFTKELELEAIYRKLIEDVITNI